MKNLDTWFGLIALTAALAACPAGDDGSSETTVATNPTTTMAMTTGETTGEETTGEPPATGEGTSTGNADSGSSGEPVTCDPPCAANEECIDGVCFPSDECDPPCVGEEMCIEGVCTPPTPTSSDYGPCDMCAPSEMPVSITGIEGCFCSPMCDGMNCPAPNEGTASAQCVLTFEMGAPPSQCALICMNDEDCPPGATCQDAGGGSICMHPA